jgi:preprotein translocase subunit SecE
MNNIGEIKENTTQFFRDVELEIKKITWPYMNDTFRSTLAVIFISAVLVLFLGLIDFVFSKIVVSILG